jgi:hypothetical protein
MAEKSDPTETVSLQELAESNMLQIEAILRILVKKNLVTKEEYIEVMRQIVEEMSEEEKKAN